MSTGAPKPYPSTNAEAVEVTKVESRLEAAVTSFQTAEILGFGMDANTTTGMP